MKLADIVGPGDVTRFTANAEECSKLCNQKTELTDCCTFEYSPRTLECLLFKRCLPDIQAQYNDYMFCKKSKFHYIIDCFNIL